MWPPRQLNHILVRMPVDQALQTIVDAFPPVRKKFFRVFPAVEVRRHANAIVVRDWELPSVPETPDDSPGWHPTQLVCVVHAEGEYSRIEFHIEVHSGVRTFYWTLGILWFGVALSALAIAGITWATSILMGIALVWNPLFIWAAFRNSPRMVPRRAWRAKILNRFPTEVRVTMEPSANDEKRDS